jgi:hypothetical protein
MSEQGDTIEPDATPLGAEELPDASPQPEDAAPEPRERKARTPRQPRKRKTRATRAPREDTRPARGARTRETTSIGRAALERGLQDSMQGIAIAVTLIDAEDGAIIARGEPRLTKALIATADQNPNFKRRLEELLQGGTYMQLAVAVGAIVLPITLRHVPGLPPAFRQASVLAQDSAVFVPDAPPAGWGDAAPSGDLSPLMQAPILSDYEPGRVYRDEQGAYTVDAEGNVTPFDDGDSGAAE